MILRSSTLLRAAAMLLCVVLPLACASYDAKAPAPSGGARANSATATTFEVAIEAKEGGLVEQSGEDERAFADEPAKAAAAPEPEPLPALAVPSEAEVAKSPTAQKPTADGLLAGKVGSIEARKARRRAPNKGEALFGDDGDDAGVAYGYGSLAIGGTGSGGGGMVLAGAMGRIHGLGKVDTGGGRGDAFDAPPPPPKPGQDGWFDGKDATKADADKDLRGKQHKRAERQFAAADAEETEKLEAEASDTLLPQSGGEVCTASEPPRPLPRRCHLEPNYYAGRASWQRRLQAMAQLPAELQRTQLRRAGTPTIAAPEGAALAVDARLDRDTAAGPGRAWMRVWLRSSDRWGLRRPPMDLAVVVSPAAAASKGATCATLTALMARVEAQDRVSLLLGTAALPQWDDVAGSVVSDRLRGLCAAGLPDATAELAAQHIAARAVLARHATAQHRIAGSRAIVVLARAEEAAAPLQATVGAATSEPTLTSALLVGDAAPEDAWWSLIDAGHGALEVAAAGAEDAAAKALWASWGRVVARLVRVDIRLAPGVQALRVVGSRVLDEQETAAVRRREQAIDRNLARVAGVRADRQEDGIGMTMLIPAFLGSDAHAIDIELAVPGAGPVAEVVVDYKDLLRMQNAKASAAAALERLQPGIARAVAVPEPDDHARVAAVMQLQAAMQVAEPRVAAVEAALHGLGLSGDDAAAMARGIVRAAATAGGRAGLRGLMQAWVAGLRGCHVGA
ncbi:MAG: hypothetical protein H6747_13960 [Deltaproteobacteria bacterium]|nr:hypothetical protein [Deltaproteobacteria bacterium]